MNLLFHIPPQNILETYRNVKKVLLGNDALIFTSMTEVTNSMASKFTPPISVTEYEQKHNEIESKFSYTRTLRGLELALRLMSEIIKQVQSVGGVPGLNFNNLLDAIVFRTNIPGVRVILTDERCYAIEWTIGFDYKGVKDEYRVLLELYDEDWDEIVPPYIVQYVHSAITAYLQGMNAVSTALISIAIEATLRDVLISKGYSFDPRANPYDIYDYKDVAVGVAGNCYTLNFNSTMPKSASDFQSSAGGQATTNVKIKREYNAAKSKFELTIKDCDSLIDHLSCDRVIQRAKKRVNSLEEALKIARHVENFLTPDILTEDFDDVIKTVRNKLIHLSGEALDTPILTYDASGNFKLRDFIDNSMMVYDLISNVPIFINKQYKQL